MVTRLRLQSLPEARHLADIPDFLKRVAFTDCSPHSSFRPSFVPSFRSFFGSSSGFSLSASFAPLPPVFPAVYIIYDLIHCSSGAVPCFYLLSLIPHTFLFPPSSHLPPPPPHPLPTVTLSSVHLCTIYKQCNLRTSLHRI